MTEYKRGQVVRMTAAFTNASGVAADPTTVTLVVEDADGTETTSSPSNTATGAYRYDLTLGETEALCPAGVWDYRFRGTGAIVAANVGRFRVSDDDITKD
jgi:hypothetical protein